MFYALIQLADLAVLGTLGFFLVFYVTTWAVLAIRLRESSKYNSDSALGDCVQKTPSFSIILPVADEKPSIFSDVLWNMKEAIEYVGHENFEVFIILNGRYSEGVETLAKEFATYFPEKVFIRRSNVGSKRKAIAWGAFEATKDIAILLDSDSVMSLYTIETLLGGFYDPKVGGIVPKQSIYYPERNIMTRLCNWYEDMRFHNTTPGLSYHGAIPCLIGRLFAIRMDALKRYMPDFLEQTVLGIKMETGDDRVLTSMLLKDGYKTIYNSETTVMTDAPETLKQFAKQRLRWARSSFRETILSVFWLWKYPYAFFIMWADIVLRWMFFSVVALFAYRVWTGNYLDHAFDISLFWYLVLGAAGFFVSGLLKQIPHLRRFPEDIKILPHFLLLNTFVLFPIEIWGNITCLKQGWMTRKVN